MNSALYWAVCFGNTKPPQTYSEMHWVHTDACNRENVQTGTGVWQQRHTCPRYRSNKKSFPVFTFTFTQPVSTGESGSSHSWYSSNWMCDDSPVYLSPAEKKAECLFPIWNMKSLFLCKSVPDFPVTSRLPFCQCGCSQFLAVLWTLLLWLYLSLSHSHRGDNVLSSQSRQCQTLSLTHDFPYLWWKHWDPLFTQLLLWVFKFGCFFQCLSVSPALSSPLSSPLLSSPLLIGLL